MLMREPRVEQDQDILMGRPEVEWWSINLGFVEGTMKLRGV